MSTDFEPGECVVWRREERGGYGYVSMIQVTVIRHGPKRVQVAAPLARGGSKAVWVHPSSLRRRVGR